MAVLVFGGANFSARWKHLNGFWDWLLTEPVWFLANSIVNKNAKAPILITGGAGFIGSHLVQFYLSQGERIINLDALTYAGIPARLDNITSEHYTFVHGSVADPGLVRELFSKHRPCAVIHLAAESHVDRSIDSPSVFISTNVIGTQVLLDASKEYADGLNPKEQTAFRFVYISTDEVFGVAESGTLFDESTSFNPSSPYAASKAAADLLTQSYFRTYGLQTVTVNPSNTYGPWQLPEKLIPRLICRAHAGKALPIFGTGKQIRDWMHVDDCCRAIDAVLKNGTLGERYLAGGGAIDIPNLQVAKSICDLLDELDPNKTSEPRQNLITHVADRLGHDFRYACDTSKIKQTLNWSPQVPFETGLKETVEWYLNNMPWAEAVFED